MIHLKKFNESTERENINLSNVKDLESILHGDGYSLRDTDYEIIDISQSGFDGEKGYVETVNGLINTETGSVTFRARFANPKAIIRSGSSATVKIPTQINKKLLIPQSATFELQDKMFAVTVGKDGKTKNVSIKVFENSAGNYYVVTEGLKTGDQIVLEGVASLKDGSEIKPTNQSQESVYADLK